MYLWIFVWISLKHKTSKHFCDQPVWTEHKLHKRLIVTVLFSDYCYMGFEHYSIKLLPETKTIYTSVLLQQRNDA